MLQSAHKASTAPTAGRSVTVRMGQSVTPTLASVCVLRALVGPPVRHVSHSNTFKSSAQGFITSKLHLLPEILSINC